MSAIFPDEYTITVDRLLAMLKEYPGDTPIIMSKDGEGNRFSPLSASTPDSYLAETTWSGDLDGSGVPVIVLWPVN